MGYVTIIRSITGSLPVIEASQKPRTDDVLNNEID